jgi:hypothetical protein
MAFAGKPLAVDPADLDLHEIFFDDNIFVRGRCGCSCDRPRGA